MRHGRYCLIPDLLVVLLGIAGLVAFASGSTELMTAMEKHLPDALDIILSMFMLNGVFIGLACLIFSLLFSKGKWWVQILLILAGVGLYWLTGLWLRAGRDGPIFFHPSLVLIILGTGAVFSGVISLVWGIFHRASAK